MPKEYLDCVAKLIGEGKSKADAQKTCAIAYYKKHGMTPQEAEDDSMDMAERLKQGWVAIFKPGRHRAMDGKWYEFSEADVAGVATAYDPAVHQSPAVIGHPAIDAPAYAWAERLEFADGILWAKLKDVAAQFSEWLRQGWYRNISASFYPPDQSPVSGRWYLKHVGFLGAAPPAVAGLPHAVFAAERRAISFEEPMPIVEELELNEELGHLEEVLRIFWDHVWSIRYGMDVPDRKAALLAKVNDLADAIDGLNFTDAPAGGGKETTVDKRTFTEWLRDGLREIGLLPLAPAPGALQPAQFTEAQVKEREDAAAKRGREDAERMAQGAKRQAEVKAEVTGFVEAGIKAGTFLPAWKEAGIPAVMEQLLLQETEIAFAEGKKANPGQILKDFLTGLPKVVNFAEIAKGQGQDPDAALKAEFATGAKVHELLGVTFEGWKTHKRKALSA